MEKSIFAFILFAFAAFALTSCDRAEAKLFYKDYGAKVVPKAVAQVAVTITPLPSFGVLPERVQVPQTVSGYPVITVMGGIRQKNGYPGYNYLQCRKS